MCVFSEIQATFNVLQATQRVEQTQLLPQTRVTRDTPDSIMTSVAAEMNTVKRNRRDISQTRIIPKIISTRRRRDASQTRIIPDYVTTELRYLYLNTK